MINEWWIKGEGVLGMSAPSRSNFFSIFCSFWDKMPKKIGWRSKCGIGVPVPVWEIQDPSLPIPGEVLGEVLGGGSWWVSNRFNEYHNRC